MKKLITIFFLFFCFTNYAQRIISVNTSKNHHLLEAQKALAATELVVKSTQEFAVKAHAQAAKQAQAALAVAHNAAAKAYTEAATSKSNKAIASAPDNAAMVMTVSPPAAGETAASLELTRIADQADVAAKAAAKAFIDAAVSVKEAEEDNDNHIIEIQGLGNIANSQNGNSLSPSASINAKISFLPKNKNAKLFLGYNLGAELDSTKLDSISLGNLFLPDRSKAGYVARFEYNIAELFSIHSTKINGYTYNLEINPFIEYNYNKINIKDVKIDSSKIQTSTWILGINAYHSIITKDNNNTIGIQVLPYFKSVTVSSGTVGTYNALFKNTLKGDDAPHNLSFAGITLGLQINRFVFSFDYQSLLTKSLKNTPLNGGVFSLRATIIGDLIKL